MAKRHKKICVSHCTDNFITFEGNYVSSDVSFVIRFARRWTFCIKRTNIFLVNGQVSTWKFIRNLQFSIWRAANSLTNFQNFFVNSLINNIIKGFILYWEVSKLSNILSEMFLKTFSDSANNASGGRMHGNTSIRNRACIRQLSEYFSISGKFSYRLQRTS